MEDEPAEFTGLTGPGKAVVTLTADASHCVVELGHEPPAVGATLIEPGVWLVVPQVTYALVCVRSVTYGARARMGWKPEYGVTGTGASPALAPAAPADANSRTTTQATTVPPQPSTRAVRLGRRVLIFPPFGREVRCWVLRQVLVSLSSRRCEGGERWADERRRRFGSVSSSTSPTRQVIARRTAAWKPDQRPPWVAFADSTGTDTPRPRERR